MLKFEQLEKRETPSYTMSFEGNIRISSYFPLQEDEGLPIFGEYEYKPFEGYNSDLNSIFVENDDLSIVSPLKNGGPRVQINKIDFKGNGAREVLFDDYVFEPSFQGGVNIAYGDVNFDDYSDLIVGPSIGGGPRLRVLSGIDNYESVLFDDFVYEDSYRGGLEVGTYGGEVFVVAKSGGGPRLRKLDIGTGDSVDFFIGDPSSRSEREVLFGDLLGIRKNYFANYEDGVLHFYDNDGKLLVKNVMPYTVNSLGLGSNYLNENNRMMVMGNLNSPFINNSNGLELIEHDPILNTFLASLAIYQPKAYLGVVTNQYTRYDQIMSGGFFGNDPIIPLASNPYQFIAPWRANLGTVYSGSGIGNNLGTGTFTTIVKDSITGEEFGLTNWHVAPLGDVHSPGPADRREILLPELFIGSVVRTLGINFEEHSINLIDASLFNTVYDKEISRSVIIGLEKSGKPVTIEYSGKTTVATGDMVYAFGRTTGPRPGIVFDDNRLISVDYSKTSDPKIAVFDDQLYILSTAMPQGFASPGDSGSIVMVPQFDGDGTVKWLVTGQIFAGNSLFGVASKWENIETLLGVELV